MSIENKGAASIAHHDMDIHDDLKGTSPYLTSHGDILAEEATGANLPAGYFRSKSFLGSTFVSLPHQLCTFPTDNLSRLSPSVASAVMAVGCWPLAVSSPSTKSLDQVPTSFGFLWPTLWEVPSARSYLAGSAISLAVAGCGSGQI